MSRRVFVLCVVSALALMSHATLRSLAEAENIAIRHYKAKAAYCNGHRVPAVFNVSLAAQSDSWMAFNTGNGFVIVGANNEQPEVLGYADNSVFDMDNLNPAMRFWLEGYDREWRCRQANSSHSHYSTMRFVSYDNTLPDSIGPLCTTEWGQRDPYNRLCPMYDDDNRAAAGCVAVAMSQVMTRWQYPLTGRGSHAYDWARGVDDTVRLSARFDSVQYNWKLLSKMKIITGDFADAVSLLVYQCGVATEMKYGSTSTTGTKIAAKSLVEYFDYDLGIQHVNADVLPTDSFEHILRHELAAGRPVIYGATSDQNTRHAFICDGYDTDGCFHINWGWNGRCDGWYRLSALAPAEQGTGGGGRIYSDKHIAITGIQPSNDNILPLPLMGIDSITVDTMAYHRDSLAPDPQTGEATLININMIRTQNFGLNDFKGRYGLALFHHTRDSIIDILDSRRLSLRAGYYRTGTNKNGREVFKLNPAALNEGVYRIAHVYRDTLNTYALGEADKWHVAYARYGEAFMYVTLTADSLLISYNSPEEQKHDSDTVSDGLSHILPPEWQLYPTIVQQGGVFSLTSGSIAEDVVVETLDVNGTLVSRQKVAASRTIRMSAPCRSGLYVVRIQSPATVVSHKLIVR